MRFLFMTFLLDLTAHFLSLFYWLINETINLIDPSIE